MKKYKEEWIYTDSMDELDLEPPFYEEDSDEPNEIEYHPEANGDTTSIGIDDLLDTINDLKNKGANRVYINVDIDHYGYEFIGVKFTEI